MRRCFVWGRSSFSPPPSPARCLLSAWGGEWWSAASWHLGALQCLAVLCCSTGRAQPPPRELNLSQTQRNFETLPAFQRIISAKGSHLSGAQHKVGDNPDTFSTWHTHPYCCLCYKTDGPRSEEYSSDMSFIVLSWVHSVFWECRDQGKSWDSALTLPVNYYGLADEVADMLDFIIFHTVFMYSLDYWFLVAFPFESFVLVLWLQGAFSSEREWEEQAGFGYEWEVWTGKVSPGGRFSCPNLHFRFLDIQGQNTTFVVVGWGIHQHLTSFPVKQRKEPHFLKWRAWKCS